MHYLAFGQILILALFSTTQAYGNEIDLGAVFPKVVDDDDDTVEKKEDQLIPPCIDKTECIEKLCKEIKIVTKTDEYLLNFSTFNPEKCEIIIGLHIAENIPGLKDKYKQEELKDVINDLWSGDNSSSWFQSGAQCGFLHELVHATQSICPYHDFSESEQEAFLEAASCFSKHANKFEDGSEDSNKLWDEAFNNFAISHYNGCLAEKNSPSLDDCEDCAREHLLGELTLPEEVPEFVAIHHNQQTYCPKIKFQHMCVERE